mgnify:CR=1 FL=1
MTEGTSRKIRVLVADDHKLLREALVLMLADEEGIEVVGEVSDGEEAVDAARQMQPDVVLMDVSMPGMSGLEATELIKSEMPHIGVVGLSMHDPQGGPGDAMAVRADAYCRKDGNLGKLVEAIQRCRSES